MRIGHESLSLFFTLHFVAGSKSLSVLDTGSPSRFARYGSAFRFSTKSKQLLFSIRTAQSENHPIRVVHFGCADSENRTPDSSLARTYFTTKPYPQNQFSFINFQFSIFI